MSTGVLLAAALVVALGASLQGVAGFGGNLVAIPLAALIDTDLVPGPILIAMIVVTVLTAVREHSDISWFVVRWATAGRLPGILAGAVLLGSVTDAALGVVIAIAVLIAVVVSTLGQRFEPSHRSLLGAGFLSGTSGTAAGIGGPPLALVLQHGSGPRVRATLAAYFTLLTPLTLAAIALAGHLTGDQIRSGLALIPAAAIGFAASSSLRPLVDRHGARPLVLTLSSASAVLLMFRSLS